MNDIPQEISQKKTFRVTNINTLFAREYLS